MWQAGQDGGHKQSFHILQRLAGTTADFAQSQLEPGGIILDPGRAALVMKRTVTALRPKTKYQFKVEATNKKGTNDDMVNAMTLG